MTTGKAGGAQDGGSSSAAVRARILAMRQAKQQQASSSSALLGVPGSSQLHTANAKHLSWYAEDDDEGGGDSVNVHGSADGMGEDESTIHGHQPGAAAASTHVTYRPASQASTTSALTTSSGRRADSSCASRPETSMSFTRPDTAASMYSATNMHTRERATNLLNEIEAELQAQRSGSPIMRSLTPPTGPPLSPLPDLPGGPPSHRSSSGSSLARTRALNGSSTSLGSAMSSDSSIGPMPTTPLPPLPPQANKQQQQRLAQRRPSAGVLSPESSNPTSPVTRAFSMRRGSASASAPLRGPPPSVPLPPTPTMYASGHGRHPSASSTMSSVSAAPLSRAASNAASVDRERASHRDTIASSSASASPRNSMSSFSRSPLGQPDVDDISENSDEALSDVLNLSPRNSPSTVFQSLQPPPVPAKGLREWTTSLSPSSADPKEDDEERRRRSLMHKSMGGLVAALTEEAHAWTHSPHEIERPPSPSARSASPSLGHENSRHGDARNRPASGAASIVSSPLGYSPDPNFNATSAGSSTLFTAPVSAPANISQLRPPMISVDDANSDTDDSDESGEDGPRKRRKQRKPKGRFNFEDQRAAAPSRQGSSAMLSPAAQGDASQWAYYQFSPDLPPYVPPGMRPTDLTGRGTWRSIAARAGGLGSARNSSVTLGSDAGDSRSATPSGPVSMREVAAQARAQVERANTLRERQHSLLAQRSFLPIDIHSHASEHAISERGSIIGSSSASLFSFDSSLRQGDTDTLSMVSDTFSLRGAGYSDVASRSSAGVGTESPDRTSTGTLVGLGIQAKPAEPVKKYVDMAMQTSPTSSPDNSPPGTPTLAPMRSEMGVGGDSRQTRRHASVIAGKSQLVWSDNEDAAAGGEVRASTPTQRRAMTPQRRTPTLSARASRARISAIPDLDDPSAWPVRLTAPRLGSRRSQLNVQGTPSRLSRMSSRLSIASSALSESTIGPDSDSESDESDLDVGETLETLAERSGALDLTARGAKRKLHARPSPADSLSAIGQRKIAPAPRSRLSALPPHKNSIAARASRLSKASTNWGSSDEEEHGDDEQTEAEGTLRTPAVIVRVLPGRSVAPATVGRASFVTTPLRPAMSLRQTASVASLRTPRRSVRMSRMQRASNQAFDLVLKPSLADTDAESLLADDLDTLPQLDDDDFMPASFARLTKSASSSPVVRQQTASTPAAAAAQSSAALVSEAVAKLSLSTAHTPAKQPSSGSGSMLAPSPYADDPSTSATSPMLPSPSNASEKRHSNSIDDTPSTHLGSELWSHAGDRRSFGTTATSVSESSLDGKATAASLDNSPTIEQEATMPSPTAVIVPIKPLTIKKLSEPKVIEASDVKAVEPVKAAESAATPEPVKAPEAEASEQPKSPELSKSPEVAKAPEPIVAAEPKPSLIKPRSALPTPRKRATSTVSESGAAIARSIDTARSPSPATKAMPAPRAIVAPRTSANRPPPSSYTGIRPPSSASTRSRRGSQSGIARPSGLKAPAPALKVDTGIKAPATPGPASAKSTSPTLRRMKSYGDRGSTTFVAPPISTLPSLVTRKAVDYSPVLGAVGLPRSDSPASRASPVPSKGLPTLKARPSMSSIPPPTPAKSPVPPTTPGKSALPRPASAARRSNNASAPGSALPRPSGIATPRKA